MFLEILLGTKGRLVKIPDFVLNRLMTNNIQNDGINVLLFHIDEISM